VKSRKKRRSSTTTGWKALALRLIQPESRLSQITHLGSRITVNLVVKNVENDPGLIRRGILGSGAQVQVREEDLGETASILGFIGLGKSRSTSSQEATAFFLDRC